MSLYSFLVASLSFSKQTANKRLVVGWIWGKTFEFPTTEAPFGFKLFFCGPELISAVSSSKSAAASFKKSGQQIIQTFTGLSAPRTHTYIHTHRTLDLQHTTLLNNRDISLSTHLQLRRIRICTIKEFVDLHFLGSSFYLPWTIQPKCKFLSLFTHPHVISNSHAIFSNNPLHVIWIM